ncbi:NAD(P)-dependent alcohol dehydrogenase [Candidatus Izimaplasma bacterium]|nr:NAD(P)-dependent alcohol dehydrogenase [Candidatus Izimaplasma bacterium]
MKAIIYEKYGSVDRIKYTDVEKPIINDDSILVKIHAASINAMDIHILQGKPLPLRVITGIFKPKYQILGTDISGTIEDIGKNISSFKIGDEVFGQLSMKHEGGYAEYALMSPKQLTKKPANATHSETASIPIAGLTALQALRSAGVTENMKVLIYGASGGVGTFLIQIAKSLKANVTAVCSTRNVNIAKKSKADIVIDYKKEEWYKEGIKYDAIIGVNGYNSLKKYRDSMTDNAIYVMVGGTTKQMIEMYFSKPIMRNKGKKQFLGFLTKGNKSDSKQLSKLLESKELSPHIDKEFALQDTKEAFKHFIAGKTIGKTIIKILQ